MFTLDKLKEFIKIKKDTVADTIQQVTSTTSASGADQQSIGDNAPINPTTTTTNTSTTPTTSAIDVPVLTEVSNLQGTSTNNELELHTTTVPSLPTSNELATPPPELVKSPSAQENQINNAFTVAGFQRALNLRDPKKGATPLHKAVKKGNTRLVRSLINNKNLEIKADEQGETPFHLAARQKNFSVTDELLTSSAFLPDYLSAQNKRGETPLHIAVASGNTKVFNAMLENKANPHVKTNSEEHGLAALSKVSSSKSALEIKKGSATALHYALSSNLLNNEIIAALLANKHFPGTNPVTAINDNGDTPLHLAMQHPAFSSTSNPSISNLSQENLNELLDKGNVELKNKQNKTMLHLAAANRQMDLASFQAVTEAAIRKGHMLNALDSSDHTALYWSVFNGDITKARYLLATSGINPNSDKHETALHLATAQKQVEVVQLLLSLEHYHALPNVKDLKGDYPLHIAVANNSKEIVEALLNNVKAPALLTVKDAKGNMPLHNAINDSNNEIIKLLIQKMSSAELSAKDAKGDMPLHRAIENGNVEIANLLIQRMLPADLNTKDSHGQIALHMTYDKHLDTLANELLAKGADVNAVDDKNRLPFHSAILRIKDDAEDNIQDANRFAHAINTLKSKGATVSPDALASAVEYLMKKDASKTLRAIFTHFKNIPIVKVKLPQEATGFKLMNASSNTDEARNTRFDSNWLRNEDTVLNYAARGDDYELAEIVLENNTDKDGVKKPSPYVNLKNAHGETPTRVALAILSSTGLPALLTAYGAREGIDFKYMRETREDTLLHKAASRGFESLEQLADYLNDANFRLTDEQNELRRQMHQAMKYARPINIKRSAADMQLPTHSVNDNNNLTFSEIGEDSATKTDTRPSLYSGPSSSTSASLSSRKTDTSFSEGSSTLNSSKQKERKRTRTTRRGAGNPEKSEDNTELAQQIEAYLYLEAPSSKVTSEVTPSAASTPVADEKQADATPSEVTPVTIPPVPSSSTADEKKADATPVATPSEVTPVTIPSVPSSSTEDTKKADATPVATPSEVTPVTIPSVSSSSTEDTKKADATPVITPTFSPIKRPASPIPKTTAKSSSTYGSLSHKLDTIESAPTASSNNTLFDPLDAGDLLSHKDSHGQVLQPLPSTSSPRTTTPTLPSLVASSEEAEKKEESNSLLTV